jgi:hypothetical protein
MSQKLMTLSKRILPAIVTTSLFMICPWFSAETGKYIGEKIRRPP